MKQFLILVVLLVLFSSLLAEVFPEKIDKFQADMTKSIKPRQPVAERVVPDWDWDIVPQELLTNYADYFQAYNQTPVALQPDEHGGGIYIIYRVKDQEGNSEVSYTYVDNAGNVSSSGMGYVGYYCDAEVDQQTGDPFACWHAYDGDDSGCYLTYDLYHIMAAPGLWKDPPILVIDNQTMQNNFPFPDDQYIWPMVHIGPSPVEDMQRVYFVASNNTHTPVQDLPGENYLLCYADFSAGDLELQSDLEWTYTSIPQLDSLHVEDPAWARPFKSWTIIDNQVIILGYLIYGETQPVDSLFCCINSNYGEGDWEMYTEGFRFEETDPDTLFPDAIAVWQNIIHTGHFNIVPTENRTKVTFPGAMGITWDDAAGDNYYYPLYFMIYPKTFSFDLETQEFSFCDVFPMGLSASDDIPAKPWDLDEDGLVDEYDPQGRPRWVEDWPIFHFDPDNAFHNNEYFLTTNEENGWMAFIWVDGKNASAANEGWEGYESWVAKPELAICCSKNWGASWSDPIYMNANPESGNYQEELDGMIPCFAYPGDRIEDIGNEQGILHLFFLDDNDYGSNHNGGVGLNNGSTFEYASLQIDFSFAVGDKSELVAAPLKAKNYPNPFNPETTIEFELQSAGNVQIDIYNIKGQKVCTLADRNFDSGKNTVTWKADNYASGVYFYLIKNDRFTTSKKMILMK
ncbi:MAG: T9SS type A sorting domain-containing protein [Candidatus Cloacimonetes bacterium]|nr:T9SS type A sorting domain-containing protein [Candidatus Cloacimonadota bacterium]